MSLLAHLATACITLFISGDDFDAVHDADYRLNNESLIKSLYYYTTILF